MAAAALRVVQKPCSLTGCEWCACGRSVIYVDGVPMHQVGYEASPVKHTSGEIACGGRSIGTRRRVRCNRRDP